ncbi:aspartate dehydrogenase [Roseivivax sp. CAU 1753]
MRLGVIGYGSIGRALIARLPREDVARVTVLVRPAALDALRDTPDTSHARPDLRFVKTCDALLRDRPDLVIECAGHAAVSDFATDILGDGTDLLVASVGAFADDALHARVTAAARSGNARLILPSGAIGGLDLLAVLAASGDVQLRYRGTKPPAAWKGSPAEDAVDLDALTEPAIFFEGSGREAALAYPKNANVVAALALAGAGFDSMTVALVADPEAVANTHAFEVVSPLCSYRVAVENSAAPDNARTSMTTVLSILHEVAQVARNLSPEGRD